MKILSFTDPHGSVRHAHEIVALCKQESPDIIVCSGDFSRFEDDWMWFVGTISVLKKKVFLVGGNHESDRLMKEVVSAYPFLVDVAYRTVEENGILIGGLPGYDQGFWPSGKVDLAAVALSEELWGRRDRSKPFVFLTHFPPAGAVDGRRYPTPDAGGSATISSIVKSVNPDLVVTGHYHQEFGRNGFVDGVKIENPGPSGKILHVKLHRTLEA